MVEKIAFSNNGKFISIIEKELLTTTPTMTSNTTPSGIITTSVNNIGNEGWKAFNRVINSGWRTSTTRPSGGHWIKYDFGIGNEKKIIAIDLKSMQTLAGSHQGSGVKQFSFYGSNDDVQYTLLLSSSHPNNYDVKRYSIENENKYRFYRLNIPTGGDVNYIALDELEMYEESKLGIREENYDKNSLENKHWNGISLLSDIDLNEYFDKKHYIQDESTPLEEGKVFKHHLGIKNILKRITVK